ncbi:MAG: hypothetical protein IJD07_00300 [Clostridia bacterium]|nr:hypothetical protein [Clostridia bacterium]
MLNKLLKKDLSKNSRLLLILFVALISVSLITRSCKALGENLVFFKILSIFFDSVFYTLAVNTILHPFLRNFLNFSRSLYGDESYLTHTLPVTKNQLVNSKFITALIEVCAGFVCLVVSILIMYYTPTFFDKIGLLLSTMIVGKVSVVLVLALFVTLVIVEFLMFLSIIFFSIVIAYRNKEKRILKTFLITAIMSFVSITVLSVFMLAVLAICGVKLTSSTLVLPRKAFFCVMLTGITVYSAISVAFYFLTKKALNKGVNID